MERIYLDNNATTIVDPMVKQAMDPYWCERYGNLGNARQWAQWI